MRVFSVATIAMLMSGCVTPQVVSPPKTTVDFRQYKTVKLVMIDEVNTPYSQEGLSRFEAFLKGRLQILGYSVGAADGDMTLEVRILSFSPGNTAARLIVGFGAGRAVLTYRASFRDRSGTLITELEGGKAFHGMELNLPDNPVFKTDEDIRLRMIQEAVLQVGQFIRNNGELK
ncbi:MAG TPA: DUF4410 domain-containing protein [Candidatus Acidoferrum sp.]|nr:DUF4410 domain-containing protein [Candidatus Acidoferrum sp.]